MKTRVLATLMALASSVGILVGTGGVASADPVATKDVTNGMALSFDGEGIYNCTLGPVGFDSAGRKVGITAGHCNLDPNNNPMAPVGEEVPNGVYPVWDANDYAFGPIGYTRFVSEDLPHNDYMVIEFVPNTSLKSQGPNLRVDSIYKNSSGNPSMPPSLFNSICKDGRTTGLTCGLITAHEGGLLATVALQKPGDSGGAAVLSPKTGTKWVGIVTRTGYIPFANHIYTSSAVILNDLNPRGIAGSGFTPVNN
ncbi:hypothetical protein [Rhodococcus daqingensis]|uniref:Serine protease n=1 Tax=Rhodococcus daqingensis TaxID=2479363 RepID=A0ABW2RTE1_9NOCA